MPDVFVLPANPQILPSIAAALVTILTLVVLVSPRVRRARAWRATITPLASIVGSGFLVVTPLLGAAVGQWAGLAMAGIVVLAWAVGDVMRYVIREAEAIEEGDIQNAPATRAIVGLGGVAKVTLSGSYLVAVAFYLHLLGAFAGRMVGLDGELLPKVVASVLLLLIAGFGALRGLGALESLEEAALSVNLAIIAGFLVALVVYDAAILGGWGTAAAAPITTDAIGLRDLRVVLGGFLVVQGFETSRFLRDEFDVDLRVRSMRWAQLIAAAIYLAFIGLATPILGALEGNGATAILDLSGRVSFLLPVLLALGAVMSQFSASVADTIGSGGLAYEVSERRLPERAAYVGIAAACLALVWSFDVFEIIAWASRAFAVAYAAYAAMAAVRAATRRAKPRQPWRAAGFALVAVAMLAVALLGIPSEAA